MDGIKTYGCAGEGGYGGTNCQTEVDPCSADQANECGDAAICLLLGPGDYLCNCVPGYESQDGARTCNDVDECESNPCEFAGVCSHQVDAYTCACRAGYEGDNCEVERDECLSEAGQNGAGGSEGDHL